MGEKIKENNKRKIIGLEQKLEIIKEYNEKVGEPITNATTYKGYHIGCWKNNMRCSYRNNIEMKGMTPELYREFKELDFIGERKRAERKTDLEKIAIIDEYIALHPEEKITTSTVAEDGTKIGEYLGTLKTKYIGDLTREVKREPVVEKMLKKRNFYSDVNPKSEKEIKDKLGVKGKLAKKLIEEYGSTHGVIKAYKEGRIPADTVKEILRNTKLKSNKLILVNTNSKNKEINIGYENIILDILNEKRYKEINDDNSIDIAGKKYPKITIMDAQIVDKLLEELLPREKELLINRYGLKNGKAQTLKELGENMQCSGERARSIIEVAIRKLRYKIRHEYREEKVVPSDKLESMLIIGGSITQDIYDLSNGKMKNEKVLKVLSDESEKLDKDIKEEEQALKVIYNYYMSSKYPILAGENISPKHGRQLLQIAKNCCNSEYSYKNAQIERFNKNNKILMGVNARLVELISEVDGKESTKKQQEKINQGEER